MLAVRQNMLDVRTSTYHFARHSAYAAETQKAGTRQQSKMTTAEERYWMLRPLSRDDGLESMCGVTARYVLVARIYMQCACGAPDAGATRVITMSNQNRESGTW